MMIKMKSYVVELSGGFALAGIYNIFTFIAYLLCIVLSGGGGGNL